MAAFNLNILSMIPYLKLELERFLTTRLRAKIDPANIDEVPDALCDADLRTKMLSLEFVGYEQQAQFWKR